MLITAGRTVVRGLVINRYPNVGITLSANGGNIIADNYIGTDTSGSKAFLGPINYNGIQVYSPNNLIEHNLLSGNMHTNIGVNGPDNIVQGNLVGTDITGTKTVSQNQVFGVVVTSSNNLIGGTTPDARNVISGHIGAGMLIYGSPTRLNRVEGNFIGCDITVRVPLGNTSCGIQIDLSAEDNVIGIEVQASDHDTIGGLSPQARNIIAANSTGILISGGSWNVVQGNFIGPNRLGNDGMGNTTVGIRIASTKNFIWGMNSGAANVIAFNHTGNPYRCLSLNCFNLGHLWLRCALAEILQDRYDEVKEPGYYSARFDVANLPSGIYFYRLQTANYSDIKKMAVVK